MFGHILKLVEILLCRNACSFFSQRLVISLSFVTLNTFCNDSPPVKHLGCIVFTTLMGGNEQVCIKIAGHIWRYFLKGGYSGRRCWVYECDALVAGYVLPSRSAQFTPTAVGREAEVSPCPGLANSGYCHLGFLLMENAACCLQKTMYNEGVRREPWEYPGEILSRSESAQGKVKGSCALARPQASARAPRPAFSCMLSEL